MSVQRAGWRVREQAGRFRIYSKRLKKEQVVQHGFILTVESVEAGGIISVIAAAQFVAGITGNGSMATVHSQSSVCATLPSQH